mgnify:CR=1 FL=1
MAIWEQPQPTTAGQTQAKAEIALCIPHRETVSMEWAIAFRHLQLPSHKYFLNGGLPIDVARETMVRSALQDPNIKYICFLDTDVVTQPDSFKTLIAIAEQKNLSIVSGLYWARKRDTIQPCAWKIIKRQGNLIQYAPVVIEEHIQKGNIIEVDACGLGLVVIKRHVFEDLDKKGVKPYFEWGLGRENQPQISEDFNFYLKCIDHLGIHPFVATSVRAYHVCLARRNKDNGNLEMVSI